MTGETLDIILISTKDNKLINFHVKSFFLFIAGIISLAILVLFIYNITIFTSHRVDKRRLERLNEENEIVRAEIDRIEHEIAGLAVLIDSLE